MSIKAKRLERSWTQAQLAEYSGLSQRTIQRMEKGGAATTETLKCLASVFETDVAALGVREILNEANLSEEEKLELKNIREIRQFIIQLIIYLVVIPFICLANYINGGNILNGLGLALAWGLWLFYWALQLFDIKAFLGNGWEKRELDKRMSRKRTKDSEK